MILRYMIHDTMIQWYMTQTLTNGLMAASQEKNKTVTSGSEAWRLGRALMAGLEDSRHTYPLQPCRAKAPHLCFQTNHQPEQPASARCQERLGAVMPLPTPWPCFGPPSSSPSPLHRKCPSLPTASWVRASHLRASTLTSDQQDSGLQGPWFAESPPRFHSKSGSSSEARP